MGNWGGGEPRDPQEDAMRRACPALPPLPPLSLIGDTLSFHQGFADQPQTLPHPYFVRLHVILNVLVSETSLFNGLGAWAPCGYMFWALFFKLIHVYACQCHVPFCPLVFDDTLCVRRSIHPPRMRESLAKCYSSADCCLWTLSFRRSIFNFFLFRQRCRH